jgi:hypothetical protein
MRSTKRKAPRPQPQPGTSHEVKYVRKKQRRGQYWLEPIATKSSSQPSSPTKLGSSQPSSPTKLGSSHAPRPVTPLDQSDWIDDVGDPFPTPSHKTLGKVRRPHFQHIHLSNHITDWTPNSG